MFRRLSAALLLAAVLGARVLAQALPGQDTVKLQFSPQSDVKEILSLYETLTGRRLIYDATVQGPVPLLINMPVAKDEAIKIMEIALLMNQFSLVPTEDPKIWKVFGIGKNPRSGGVPIYTDANLLPDNEQIVSYLFKIQYADPTELATQLGQAFPANPVLQGASMVPLPKAQALLVTENTAIIRQIVRIVQELDVQPAMVESRFFPLERADAKDIQEKLTEILTKKEATATTAPGAQPGGQPRVVRTQTTPEGLPLPGGNTAAAGEVTATSVEINVGPTEESFVSGKVKITADTRTNRLHIIARPKAMEEIAKLIAEFDANVPFGEPSVYPLRFVSAGDVFQVIVKAISDPGQQEQAGASGAQGGNRTGQTATRTGNTGSILGNNTNSGRFGESGIGGGGGGSSQTLSESLNAEERDIVPDAVTVGNARVIADKRANAIIVVGNQDVKEKLFAVIKQLDVRAPQVMLHTCIGQLTLSENEQFGVNYIVNQSRDLANFSGGAAAAPGGTPAPSAGGSVLSFNGNSPLLNIANLLSQEQVRNIAVGGATGLSGFFTGGNAFNAIVTALESTTKFRVVSRPVIFTTNNKKAVISSGEEIAVPTTIQSGFGGSNTANNGLVTNSSISYKNVALTLEVLPLINADDEVYMDIVQKIDEQSGSDTIDGNAIPRIASRVLKTSVSVPNGATLVLGGLIKQRNTKSFSGIPLLSRLPLLGGLFRTTTYDKSREELVILIRPVVTNTPDDSVRATEDESEFLRMEPDLERTLNDPQVRQRTALPEELLRTPAAPGLRGEAPKPRPYSGRPTFEKPVPEVRRAVPVNPPAR
ncbi:MAG: secretin N-terminal domain-containing protein [Chthoniobacteraceae bacterium]